MPQTNQEQPKKDDQFCFQLGQVSVDSAQEGNKKRTFSGIAYSGEAITDHWYWDKVVFDLDSKSKAAFLRYLSIVRVNEPEQSTLIQ